MIILESYLHGLNNYKIGKSNIHGNGIIATKKIKKGDFINTALLPKNGEINTTHFGSYLNHCSRPNANTKKEGDNYKTYSIVDINIGNEITVDYTKNKDLEQPQEGWK